MSSSQEKPFALVRGLVTELGCPACGPAKRLVVREVRASGRLFLGCETWPFCPVTRPIPESLKMRAAGQPSLFD